MTILYTLNASPMPISYGGLIADPANLYGTTYFGGTNGAGPSTSSAGAGLDRESAV